MAQQHARDELVARLLRAGEIEVAGEDRNDRRLLRSRVSVQRPRRLVSDFHGLSPPSAQHSTTDHHSQERFKLSVSRRKASGRPAATLSAVDLPRLSGHRGLVVGGDC